MLIERHIVLDLITNNKFQFIKGPNDGKDDQFKEIKEVLNKAIKKIMTFSKIIMLYQMILRMIMKLIKKLYPNVLIYIF